ncbi:hypothetical protein A2U01_0080514, partial [Trifolium medium]|nr:hypothetical protein [Trifolium medium]
VGCRLFFSVDMIFLESAILAIISQTRSFSSG